jgi:hypothetical protein
VEHLSLGGRDAGRVAPHPPGQGGGMRSFADPRAVAPEAQRAPASLAVLRFLITPATGERS